MFSSNIIKQEVFVAYKGFLDEPRLVFCLLGLKWILRGKVFFVLLLLVKFNQVVEKSFIPQNPA